jgi:phosphate transport system permease protein
MPMNKSQGRPPLLKRHKLQWNLVGEWTITAISFLAIAFIVLIFFFVFREASPIFYEAETRDEVTLQTMFVPQEYDEAVGRESRWAPVSLEPKYGIWPLITATLKISFMAVLLALPVGLLGAVYSAEFAPRRVREVLKPAVELLAGIPSVVLGFFALIVMASWLQNLFGWDFRLNAFLAAVALSVAVLPIIFSVSEDALLSVPKSIREASAALGATQVQTAFRTVVPAALPGLFGAVVLAVGRVIGETMVVLMASGNAAVLSLSILDPARTLSATIAAEMAEVVTGSPHYQVLFLLGIVLLLFTSFFNWIGDFVMHRFMRKLHGST